MKMPEINQFFRFDVQKVTDVSVKRFIERANQEDIREKERHYAIADEQDEYLGTVSLKNIDYCVRSAEFAIALRKTSCGQGIGGKATREILRIAFDELELKRVYLNTLSDNLRAIKMYEKNGFIFEGKFRNHIKIHGMIKSLSWYAILEEEYRKILL